MLFELLFLKDKPDVEPNRYITFVMGKNFVDVDGISVVRGEYIYLMNEEFDKFDDLQIFNPAIRDMIGYYGFVFVKDKDTGDVYYLVADNGSYTLTSENVYRIPMSHNGKIIGEVSFK